MKVFSLCLLLATFITVTAKADTYDASQDVGLTTRIVSSKGTTKVSGWMLEELARQTAANKEGAKRALNVTHVASIKATKVHAKAKKPVQVETIVATDDSQDDADQPAVTPVGYTPRSYTSQYYMPYAGHVSAPEPETDYR